MALRFFDTNFYKSPFVRGLEGAIKGLYSFIICDCKSSGIWAKDLEVASLYVGFKLTEKQFDIFEHSGKAINLQDGNYFFPDFIEHQYPKGLSTTNPAHINIILELNKYKLLDDNLKPLASPSKGAKVMVKVKVMETVKEKVMVKTGEVEIYNNLALSPLEKKFDEFLKYRKAKKSTILPESIPAFKAKLLLLSGNSENKAIEILEQSIAQGWQGIFEIKQNTPTDNKSQREIMQQKILEGKL